MVLTAVAGHGVRKDETAVYLVPVQGGTGPGNIIGYPDVDRICSTEFISEIIPKHTRMTSTPRLRQLNLRKQTITLRHRYHQRTTVHNGIRQPDGERREGVKALRLRDVLVSQHEESVVSRHEQILAEDKCPVIERRPTRFHLRRETIPDELCRVGNSPPSGQCPAMHVQMLQLARSTHRRDANASGYSTCRPYDTRWYCLRNRRRH